MTVLYFADPTDPTNATVGLDLNGLASGDPNGFQILAIDWGDVDPEVTWHSDGEIPGAEQIRNHPGPVQADITLLGDFTGTDYETLLDTYRTLARFFNSEGVLVWQPDGQSYPQFFDTYPSPIPALFRGTERQGLRILEQLLDRGYTFSLWRHPYPRREPVMLLDAVAVSNALNDNVLSFTNPGSALSEARLEVEVPGSEWVTHVDVGFTHHDDVNEFLSTLSGFAITANSVEEHWKRIDRHVFSPTTPADFAGTYRVIATVQLAEDVFHFRLFSGATRDADQDLPNQNEEVIFDATDLTNFSPFVRLNLGLVTYDAESPDLVVEIHAWSEDSTDVGGWGNVYLIPADDGAFVYRSPGYNSGVGGEVYRGELFNRSGGASLDDDEAVILDTDGAIAEAKPVAGQTLSVGPHILTFRGSAHNRERTRVKLAELNILRNGSTENTVGIISKAGRSVTYYGSELTRRIDFRVTDDTDLYRFIVEEVETTDPRRWTKVAAVTHRAIPPITDGRSLVVDAGTRNARIVDPDGARVASLRATGMPFLQPGVGAVAVLLGEIATAGYSHVDERGVLPQIDGSTQALVTLIVTPRDLMA